MANFYILRKRGPRPKEKIKIGIAFLLFLFSIFPLGCTFAFFVSSANILLFLAVFWLPFLFYLLTQWENQNPPTSNECLQYLCLGLSEVGDELLERTLG